MRDVWESQKEQLKLLAKYILQRVEIDGFEGLFKEAERAGGSEEEWASGNGMLREGASGAQRDRLTDERRFFAGNAEERVKFFERGNEVRNRSVIKEPNVIVPKPAYNASRALREHFRHRSRHTLARSSDGKT